MHYLIPIVTGAFLVLIIWGAIMGAQEETRNNRQNYEQCKMHTTDLEWCFKQFKPTNL